MTRAADRAYTGLRNRNVVINGNFNLWQRGSPFVSPASGAYTADRWRYGLVGTATHTISSSSDVPTAAQAGARFAASMLIDCTTADTSIAAGDISSIQQRVEGYNWAPLDGHPTTVSFWVKATKTGTYCFSMNNSAGDRSIVMEYTVDASNTWEKKVLTMPANPSSGTWNYSTGIGVALVWALACGSTYHTTPGSWQTGNYIATSNQVNATDSIANDFYITGVQLERGSEATDFEVRTLQEELLMCQRYYQKPGYGVTTTTMGWAASSVTSSHNLHTSVSFPVDMRVAPTLTYVEWSSNGFPTTANFQVVTVSGFNCYKTASSAPANPYWFGTYIADAEL